MNLVVDASAVLAVIVSEPERSVVLEVTMGQSLVAPDSLRWEIGNAFSAMLKRSRISLQQAQQGYDSYKQMPIRSVEVNIRNALEIAHQCKLYAYDAYFIECAQRYNCPLLTLDRTLRRASIEAGVNIVEL